MIVLFENISDDIANLMSADCDPPPQIAHGVVGTRASCVALALKGVACDGAEGRSRIASTHVDWVGRVAEVVSGSIRARLMATNVVAWRGRKSQTSRGKGVRESLVREGRKAKGQAKEGGDDTSKRVSSEPYTGIGIQGGNVVVQLLSSCVVMTLFPQVFDQTCRIARVRRRLAVADLLPEVLPTLAATTAPEEVVVHLVIARRIRTIKYSGRGSLQADDDRLVLGVCKDVASQTIVLPAKIFRVVETASNILPFASVGFLDICVRGHARETDDRLLVGDIGSGYVVYGPGRWRQRDSLASQSASLQETIYCCSPAVYHALNGRMA